MVDTATAHCNSSSVALLVTQFDFLDGCSRAVGGNLSPLASLLEKVLPLFSPDTFLRVRHRLQ